MSQKPTKVYGGQAVIEGVMFAGETVHVTAVRLKNQEIRFHQVVKNEKPWVKKLKKIPFIRGIIGIIEASANGSGHLNFSAEMYAEDEEEQKKELRSARAMSSDELEEMETHKDELSAASENSSKQKEKGSLGNLSLWVGVAAAGVISFAFGFLMFTLLPVYMEHYLFQHVFKNHILHNFVEGIIKSIILLIYLFVIAQTPLIKRLFQYHGAEHKVISAFEANVELTPQNVKPFSRLHYRCGSSFIILTVIMGIIIYSFVPWHTLTQRVVERIVLMPVVIGISYETLRLTNLLRETPILKYMGYPGLWLQLLTTKEPDLTQIEVSIASFQRMRQLDEENLRVM